MPKTEIEKKNESVCASVAEDKATSSFDCNVDLICSELPSSDNATSVPDGEASSLQRNGRPSRKRAMPCAVKEETNGRKRPKGNKKDDMTWICTECKEAEALDDKDAVLLICEGPCNRPFHTICVGLEREHITEETWVCADCKANRHLCSICQEYGQDNIDVFKCQASSCGLFFHESCLSTYNVDVKLGSNERLENQNISENNEDAVISDSKPLFKCPAHQCWTCTEEMVIEEEEKTSEIEKGKKGKRKKSKTKKDKIFATKKGQLIVSMSMRYLRIYDYI